MWPIIAKRKLWFTISIILVATSIVFLLTWGLRPGIDFTGGTQLEMRFTGSRPVSTEVEAKLQPLKLGTISTGPLGDTDIIIRSKPLSDEERQKVINSLQGAFGADKVAERQFETIGPTIGAELKRKTVWAIVLAILAISLYITWAFRRVSYPVKSWKYGVCTVIALMHDVIIPAGAFSIMSHFYGSEIGVLFVTALLTILGFSVHDTIVVFDRIRENLPLQRHLPFDEVVNNSVNQTMARSINTTLTVLLVLVATYIFGGVTTRDFIFTITIGIVFGTYSSVFLASPLLVSWHNWESQKRK